MGEVILNEINQDVSLKDYTLDNLPLLKRLREQHFKAQTEICIERARFITRYMKETEGEKEHPELRRARAINYYLSNRDIIFHDDNMIAGSTTSKLIGAPLYPETIGLTIWPELETISTRKIKPQVLTKEEAEELNFEIFPYWLDRTILEITRKEKNPPGLKLMEKIAFFLCGKSTVVSHTTPYFEPVLQRGLISLIQDVREKINSGVDGETNAFYKAMIIAMQGILRYAQRLSWKAAELATKTTDPEKKKNFQMMSQVCKKVPANPATTFREAINSLWICEVGILAENVNMAMNPGRLDQLFYPYFKKDITAGRLTLEEAITLTGCLWFKIADNTNPVPITSEKLFGGAGSVPAVTLGGVDKDGKDAVNDLTYIMLRVTELLRIKDPNVNARYNYQVNDKKYRDRVCEVIINTRAIPAMYNDVSNISTLENQGVSTEHARDYAVIGCVELGSAGREFASTSSILFNISAAMDLALFNGKRPFITGDEQIGPQTGDPENFQSFDQFWEAFRTQLRWLLEQAIDLNEAFARVHQQHLPSPLLSCFFDGPLEKGKDLIFGGARYNSSGATHVAFADVCDSLNAIEAAVFQEKKLTLSELAEAVRTDFASRNGELLSYLNNKAPKFGTEHPIALKNSQNLIRELYDIYQSHTNYRGGKYRPAYWTMTNHAGLGRICGALPSGRRAREVFSSGITPASQRTPELLPAFITVAALDSKNIPGGVALNMKYTPEIASDKREQYLQKFGDMIEAYFKHGGMQVQFNIQTYETLIDARKHPEKYPELIVRVSGYSAYFKDLSDAMKDELIRRTQYNLWNGKAVPLPSSYEGGE